MFKTKLVVPKLALLTLFAISCNSETIKPDTETNNTPKQTVKIEAEKNIEKTPVIKEPDTEEVLLPEGTSIEGEEDRLKDFSREKCISDCYIVDYFLEMDVPYITVDFVSYKIVKVSDGEGDGGGDERAVLVNELKKLRTFIVETKYKTCGRNKTKTIEELVEMWKKDPKTVFSLEAEEGIVNEFYFDNCSG